MISAHDDGLGAGLAAPSLPLPDRRREDRAGRHVLPCPDPLLTDRRRCILKSMERLKEEIAPEIIQALVAQATGSGLSVNDYLARLLGLADSGRPTELAMAEVSEEPPLRNEAMLSVLARSTERLKEVPVSGSTEETLRLIREARAGRMWGYEPTE
jgi:hypothetical protein